MIIKKVTQISNPLIRKKSIETKDVSSKLVKKLIEELIDSMRHYNLVGMAAVQIGSNLRVFVTEVRKTKLRKQIGEGDKLRVYINPKITWRSKEQSTAFEGCGSVVEAGLFGPVERPNEITIEAQDKKGDMFKFKAGGLLARVIQHESDHLDGILFTDKLDDVKKIMNREEYLNK